MKNINDVFDIVMMAMREKAGYVGPDTDADANARPCRCRMLGESYPATQTSVEKA
jgi:hypothetical protein